MKYRVELQTVASASVYIDIPEEMVMQGDMGAIEDYALDEAYQEVPMSLCIHCSGYGQGYSVNLGEWESTESQVCAE